MSFALFKNLSKKMCYILYAYVYKEDLALNNLKWLRCHKTKPNQSKK